MKIVVLAKHVPDATGERTVVFCDGGERYLSERFWENPPEGALVSGTN